MLTRTVVDTSVLVDLENGQLLEANFRLDRRFIVPDKIYQEQISSNNRNLLLELGLVIELTDYGSGIDVLEIYDRYKGTLSLPDCSSLALALSRRCMLLTGGARLRQVAGGMGVECHGTLWLIDQMHAAKVATPQELYDGLIRMSQNERCWLPMDEIERRLNIFRKLLS